MKITKIVIEKMDIPLIRPFHIAFQTYESAPTVLVKIETDEGLSGYGEASGQILISGETVDSCVENIRTIGSQLIGEDPLNIVGIHELMDKIIIGNPATKAGIDIALYDLAAKKMGVPLYRYLGGSSNKGESDVTVGINPIEVMLKDAREILSMGFRVIKVKIGKSPMEDIELIRIMRQELGPKVRLHLDANQGYTVPDAIYSLNKMAEYNINAVEQPVKWWDLEGLKEIRQKISIHLLADESVQSLQDAYKLAAMRAVDGLNIKLMKSGGLYRAGQICTIAEAAGLSVMVGCMLESKIGLTAAVSLRVAHSIITRADLDSHFYVKESPYIQGGYYPDCGNVVCPEEPGLGITVNM